VASTDIQFVDILADLRALPLAGGVPAIPLVEVIRATTGTTTGGGTFRFDETSSAPDDGATVLRPSALTTTQPGRWLRRDTARPVAGWWGAAGNGTTDDSAALAAADAYAAIIGSSLFIEQPHRVDQDLTFTAPVVFEAAGRLVVGHEVLSFTGSEISYSPPAISDSPPIYVQKAGPVVAADEVPPYLLFIGQTAAVRGRRFVQFGEALLPTATASWAESALPDTWYFRHGNVQVDGQIVLRGQIPRPSRIEIDEVALASRPTTADMGAESWSYGNADQQDESTVYLRLNGTSPVEESHPIRAMHLLPKPPLIFACDVDITPMPSLAPGYAVADASGAIKFTIAAIRDNRLYASAFDGASSLPVGTALQYRVASTAPWQPLGTVSAVFQQAFQPHALWGFAAFRDQPRRIWVQKTVIDAHWHVARPHRITFTAPVTAPLTAHVFVDGDIRFAAGQVSSIGWFGASATEAVDSLPAIQAALDAVHVAGGEVQVPGGVGKYHCGDPMVLGHHQIDVGSNTTLRWLGQTPIACDANWLALRGGLLNLRRTGDSVENVTIVDAVIDAGGAQTNNGIGLGTSGWERWIKATARRFRLERPYVYNVTGDTNGGQGGKALTFQFGVEDVVISDARVEDAFIAVSLESAGRDDVDQSVIRNVLVNGLIARRVSRIARLLQMINTDVAAMHSVRMTGLVGYEVGLSSQNYDAPGTGAYPGDVSGAIEVLGGSGHLDVTIMNPDNMQIGAVVSCMGSNNRIDAVFKGRARRLIDLAPAVESSLGGVASGRTGQIFTDTPRRNNRITVDALSPSTIDMAIDTVTSASFLLNAGATKPVEGDVITGASGGEGVVIWSKANGSLIIRSITPGFKDDDEVSAGGIVIGRILTVKSPVIGNDLRVTCASPPSTALLGPDMRVAASNLLTVHDLARQQALTATLPAAILAAGTPAGWYRSRRGSGLASGADITLWAADEIPFGWMGTIEVRSSGGTYCHQVRAAKSVSAPLMTLHDVVKDGLLELRADLDGNIKLFNTSTTTLPWVVTWDEGGVFR
jgi:hypothetical protein